MDKNLFVYREYTHKSIGYEFNVGKKYWLRNCRLRICKFQPCNFNGYEFVGYVFVGYEFISYEFVGYEFSAHPLLGDPPQILVLP